MFYFKILELLLFSVKPSTVRLVLPLSLFASKCLDLVEYHLSSQTLFLFPGFLFSIPPPPVVAQADGSFTNLGCSFRWTVEANALMRL